MRKIIACLLIFILIVFGGAGCKSADNQPIDDYFISVIYKNGQILGEMEYEFCFKEVACLEFNLYFNACENNGEKMVVNSVEFGGKSLYWQVLGASDSFLQVRLPSGLKKGERYSLKITFECFTDKSLSLLGGSKSAVTFGYFYPVLAPKNHEQEVDKYQGFKNPYYSDFANYSLQITVPSIISVATAGNIKGIALNGETTTYLYGVERAKGIAFSLSSDYSIAKGNYAGVDITYFYYADDNPNSSVDLIAQGLDFLKRKVYEYPYKQITVCQAPTLKGGKYTALCMVEDEKSDNYKVNFLRQIFYQVVPITLALKDSGCAYFEEGIAEFLTYAFLEEKDSGALYLHALHCESLVNNYLQKTGGGKNGSLNMKKNLNEFLSQEEYFVIARYKGFLFFYDLNKKTNEIFAVIKKLYDKKGISFITEKDFINCFTKRRIAKKSFNQIVFSGGNITLEK